MDLHSPHRAIAIAMLFWAAIASAGTQPKFSIVATFPSRANPGYPPVQGLDGNFYGTTAGNPEPGTIYQLTPAGVLTTIYTFCSQPNCADGVFPRGGLVLGTDGNFYGTTSNSGGFGWGTVFRITPSGALATLFSFDQSDGAFPCDTLIQANNGKFYGTTSSGGANSAGGTIFNITPAGALTTLYNFHNPTGANECAALLQAASGSYYGTTKGNTYGAGTIFALSPSGTFTTVHQFMGSDGANPQAGLLETAAGNFYGTTYAGGANNRGTVFELAPNGTLTTLHSFGSSADGASPYAPLVYSSDGKFYGTTTTGGDQGGNGTIFQVSSSGNFARLYSFRPGQSGMYGLTQATNGVLYGTAVDSVYSLSAGLPPLIKTVPLSGPVGTAVVLLGTNLTGSTSVTFNGAPAAFTVVSATEITATIPASATTGKVQVTTPSGTLTNVGQFIVTK